jgi:hypothetical protein
LNLIEKVKKIKVSEKEKFLGVSEEGMINLGFLSLILNYS